MLVLPANCAPSTSAAKMIGLSNILRCARCARPAHPSIVGRFSRCRRAAKTQLALSWPRRDKHLKDATENFCGDPFADKERADDSRREAETAGEAAGQRERVDQEAGHHRLRNL